MKHNLESRFLGEISITSDMHMTPPYGRKQRGTKEPLEKSEKAGLKVNIHMSVPMADKDPYSQSYGVSKSHVQKWELDHKEGWVPKNWCFQTVVLEKMLEMPLDCKEIKPVNPKGNQTWMFICWCWSSNALATWCEEHAHWKRSWCWEGLRAGEEGGYRG